MERNAQQKNGTAYHSNPAFLKTYPPSSRVSKTSIPKLNAKPTSTANTKEAISTKKSLNAEDSNLQLALTRISEVLKNDSQDEWMERKNALEQFSSLLEEGITDHRTFWHGFEQLKGPLGLMVNYIIVTL
jgi:hypothetical protein